MLTPLGWGLEAAVEASGGRWTLQQMGLGFWAHSLTVAARLPKWSKPVWTRGSTGILQRWPRALGG